MAKTERLQVLVESRAELRKWLTAHHRQQTSIWLVTYRKPGPRYIPYEAIVEEALCFGWIDSQPKALDETRSMRLLSPRRAGSNWSKVNKEKAERLITSGAMTAAGRAVIEAARRDGSWSALDEVEELVVPPDLKAALQSVPKAGAFFSALPRSSVRLILEWIESAKKPETRQARITETVSESAAGRRAHHARQPKGTGS